MAAAPLALYRPPRGTSGEWLATPTDPAANCMAFWRSVSLSWVHRRSQASCSAICGEQAPDKRTLVQVSSLWRRLYERWYAAHHPGHDKGAAKEADTAFEGAWSELTSEGDRRALAGVLLACFIELLKDAREDLLMVRATSLPDFRLLERAKENIVGWVRCTAVALAVWSEEEHERQTGTSRHHFADPDHDRERPMLDWRDMASFLQWVWDAFGAACVRALFVPTEDLAHLLPSQSGPTSARCSAAVSGA